ncbi:hypothetical protein [Zoogloea sp.]|jgi:hypothetical protein|uniref:hypothetical protein n=1 Tax=Zoogloea sp. TaxID=49181 RepID=UPI0037D9BC96
MDVYISPTEVPLFERAAREILHGSSLGDRAVANIGRLAIGRNDERSIRPLTVGYFDWPWFEEWAQQFRETKRWPGDDVWYSVRRLSPGDRLGERSEDERRAMLCQAINKRAFNLFRLGQVIQMLDDQKNGLLASRYAPVFEHSETALSKRLAKERLPTILDPSFLPPFYPGDRTQVGLKKLK